MLLVRLLTLLVSLVTCERVTVNRRARQRIRPVTTETDDLDSDRRFMVQNAFSSLLAVADDVPDANVTLSPPVTRSYTNIVRTAVSDSGSSGARGGTRAVRARVPRRRLDISRSRDTNNVQTESSDVNTRSRYVSRTRDPVTPSPAVTSAPVSRERSRARIPRRRVSSVSRDLERNERNIANSVYVEAPVSNDISGRSRSRSRHRSQVATTTERSAAQLVSRGRGLSRANTDNSYTREYSKYRADADSSRFKSDISSGSRFSDSSASSRFKESSSDAKVSSRSKSEVKSGPKLIFPRKDLFSKFSLSSLDENEIDTGYSDPSVTSNLNYRANKERLKASLYDKSRDIAEPQQPDFADNIIEDDYNDDYSYTDIQSGLTDTAPDYESSLVTVIHQVPTRTVFTVIERGETKSLYADVLETSLELVDLNSLSSTTISNSQVYYSHVETQYAGFGTTEFTYDAILPTPSLTSSLVTVNIGGRVTSLLETLETTLWRAETVRETVTPAPVTQQPLASPVAGPGVGQISQIIQNVLLSLIGGGLLGGGGGGAGPQETQTTLVTHTKTLLTTTTNTDTVLIPVNYRGTEIYQTVTEHNLVTLTTTEHSVQTKLNYVPASSKPFYPLAPTLHRAVRIVPNDSPMANLANLYGGQGGQQPPAIQSTKLVTRPVTVVTTISTDVTTPLTVTLGAREILTEIVEPTTTVVTTTTFSTETVIVNDPSPQSLPLNKAAAFQNYVNRLKLVKSLLGLKL